MPSRRVKCPRCGGILSLPGEIGDCIVRCGLCREKFRLPAEKAVPEDTIFGWLHVQEDEDERAGTLVPLSGGKSPQTNAAPKKPRIRLVSLERRGAMFEFPVEYLRNTKFRCAIPRVCIHCLGQAHLSAHLIIFAPQMRDSISLEAEHQAGRLIIPQEKLKGLRHEQLLEQLPEIPNVPPPANLPMPYWVCELCSGTGSISGQIYADSESGRGYCRLFIRNIQVAASFLAAVAGTHNPDFTRFVEFVNRAKANHWDALPTVVRHRLEQWFKPSGEEQFVAYVPDRGHARSEDGMAGIVVSTNRIIYRRPPVHQELMSGNQITLQMRAFQGKKMVTISAEGFKERPILLDREGETLFRKALSEAKFKAVWQ